MQDTSLDVYYNKVLPNLSRKQRAVLCFFQQHPGRNFTNMEVAECMGWSINRVTPRVLELRKAGLLVKHSRRVCGVTGNVAFAWKPKH